MVVVGNFEMDGMKEMIANYLGPLEAGSPFLPLGKVPESIGSIFPATVKRETMRLQMVAAQACAQLSIPFVILSERRLEDTLWLDVISKLVQKAVLEALRFDKSNASTYSVSVRTDTNATAPVPPSTSAPLDIHGYLIVSFSCEPTPGVVEARGLDALNALNKLCTDGPTEEQVVALVQQHERSIEDQLQQNSFWLSQICANYATSRYKGQLLKTFRESISTYLEVMRNLTQANMQRKTMQLFGVSLGLELLEQEPSERYTMMMLEPASSNVSWMLSSVGEFKLPTTNMSVSEGVGQLGARVGQLQSLVEDTLDEMKVGLIRTPRLQDADQA